MLIPNTTCRRCHRQYSVLRNRCPYCGTKKSREVQRSVPSSDSAVEGSPAASQAATNLTGQMLVGAVVLLCLVAALVAMISVGVRRNIDTSGSLDAPEPTPVEESDVEPTAVPTSTPEPTPSPTPAQEITSVTITFQGMEETSFMEAVGTIVPLDVTWYPATVTEDEVEILWTSSDESVAVVDQEGNVTLVGAGQCVVGVTVNGTAQTCDVWSH